MADTLAALVGGDSLLGADVRELVAESFPQVRMKLVGSDPDTAVLTKEAGEAVVMTGLDAGVLRSAKAVLLCGSAESSRRTWRMVQEAGATAVVVDFSHELESLAEARIFAGSIDAAGTRPVWIVPHPAAALLARLIRCVHESHQVVRAVAVILAPASERGRAGVRELQNQTAQLLSFRPLERDVFGEQLSFNLLGGGLEPVEARIESHLASLCAAPPAVPMASVRAVQAPVMHGYTCAVWIETAKPAGIKGTLRDRGFDLWPDDPPHVAGVAGQHGVSLGRLQQDRNNPRAVWIWAVADQFRLMADEALPLLKAVL